MNSVFIYALNDPLTGKCRYVGKTTDPRARLFNHCCPAIFNVGQSHKDRWIKKLAGLGLKPVLEILDEVPSAEWEFWEREYIRLFSAIGINLTNALPGGEGSPKGSKLSEEHRRKIGEARRGMPGKIPTQATRQKMS